MWPKYLVIFLLFYLFAMLQNSFFAHFNLFGAVPNIVFILFFVLVFYCTRGRSTSGLEISFYAISAGLFLDFLSSTYFGVSIILLLIIGFFAKTAQSFLQEKRNDKFPIIYFLPLLLASLLAYDLLLGIFSNKFNLTQAFLGFGQTLLPEIIYNLLVAIEVLYFNRKLIKTNTEDHQLRLFG
ncbi:MAG: rod shape-determining protein MreD [Candidatus Staskawiczbacteria bacterium]|nr:rod shape-determining protein MreD [Candidatus Staskawiczbacteria bacterium]